jgi:hypothetical protein
VDTDDGRGPATPVADVLTVVSTQLVLAHVLPCQAVLTHQAFVQANHVIYVFDSRQLQRLPHARASVTITLSA